MKFLINEYPALNGKIITICDAELCGNVLESEEIKYEIGKFYEGKEVSSEEISKSLFENAISIHAVGRRSIELLIKLDVISEEDAKRAKIIEGVPILLIFNVQENMR